MYITINGIRYDDAKRAQTSLRVTYLSSELAEGIAAEGSIAEYRDDGFLLRELPVSGYARQVSGAGLLTLTNEPEVQPEEEPSAEELFDVLLGGEEA